MTASEFSTEAERLLRRAGAAPARVAVLEPDHDAATTQASLPDGTMFDFSVTGPSAMATVLAALGALPAEALQGRDRS